MLKPLALAVIMLTTALVGACVSMGAQSSKDPFGSLQLFDANSHPDFQLRFACSGTDTNSTMQCETVERIFYTWGRARDFEVKQTDADALLDKSGTRLRAAHDAPKQHYIVAISFRPIVTPSFDTWSGTAGTMTSGFVPGRVGYESTIFVFAAGNGSLLKKLSFHNQESMPQHADVTPAMKADLYELITRIDPGYSP